MATQDRRNTGSRTTEEELEELSDEFPGLTCTESDAELVEMCDMIVLAVKPQYLQDVIDDIRPGDLILSVTITEE